MRGKQAAHRPITTRRRSVVPTVILLSCGSASRGGSARRIAAPQTASLGARGAGHSLSNLVRFSLEPDLPDDRRHGSGRARRDALRARPAPAGVSRTCQEGWTSQAARAAMQIDVVPAAGEPRLLCAHIVRPGSRPGPLWTLDCFGMIGTRPSSLCPLWHWQIHQNDVVGEPVRILLAGQLRSGCEERRRSGSHAIAERLLEASA